MVCRELGLPVLNGRKLHGISGDCWWVEVWEVEGEAVCRHGLVLE